MDYKTFGDLFYERHRLIQELRDRTGLGTGSSVIKAYEQRIKNVEQEILQAIAFTCPHCHKSLRHLYVPDYQI
jgi:hypothetical protein